MANKEIWARSHYKETIKFDAPPCIWEAIYIHNPFIYILSFDP